MRMQCPDLSVYDATAAQLQKCLKSGDLTSVHLTTAYLDQIDKHNIHGFGLRGVKEVAPHQLALERAKCLMKKER